LYDYGILHGFHVVTGNTKLDAVIERANLVDSKVDANSIVFDTTQFQENPTNSTDLLFVSVQDPPANAEIEVHISLLLSISLTGEALTLVLPTTFLPRKYAHEEKGGDINAKYGLSLDLNINMFTEVCAVTSPCHPCQYHNDPEDAKKGKLNLKPGIINDSDIFVYISLEKQLSNLLPRCFLESDEKATLILVAMKPNLEELLPAPPMNEMRELLLVVDRFQLGEKENILCALREAVSALEGVSINFNIFLLKKQKQT